MGSIPDESAPQPHGESAAAHVLNIVQSMRDLLERQRRRLLTPRAAKTLQSRPWICPVIPTEAIFRDWCRVRDSNPVHDFWHRCARFSIGGSPLVPSWCRRTSVTRAVGAWAEPVIDIAGSGPSRS
jgi:hypothetical protein